MGRKRTYRPNYSEAMELYEDSILEEVQKDYGSSNPLEGKVVRAYFVSTSNGKGKNPRKLWREVELIGIPGANGFTRYLTVKDYPTGGLDSIAEELISPELVPPHVTPFQHFLDLFRMLTPGKKGLQRNRKKH